MVKAGKLKSGARSKLNRWAKGGSSSSNPSCFTFRQKARSSFFQNQPGLKTGKTLTKGALKLHNEIEPTGKSGISKSVKSATDSDMASDTGSVETFGSFLSGVSDCTNVTFRKIQKYWQHNSAQHKEVCAVLAAITEVIREQKSEESDTAYFAALFTALSNVEKVESAAAISYLLAMVVKNVPVPVLRAKFGEVSKLLCNVLNQVGSKKKKSAPSAFMRSIFLILATLLRHQEYDVWEDSSTMTAFRAILLHVNHVKPKVRKAAQDAVCVVLHGSDFMQEADPGLVHPAALITAEDCISKLEKFGGFRSTSGICHMLALLGRIYTCFSKVLLKKACETVLRVMVLGDSVVKSACLKSLKGVFTSHKTALNPDLNGQVITALYDFYPNASDAVGSPIWLSVMEKAVLNLTIQFAGNSKAVHLIITHIPKLFVSCFKLLLSTAEVVQDAAATTVQNLLKEGVAVLWDNTENLIDEADQTKFVSSIFKILEDGLKYKYHAVWNLVFKIIESSFNCFVNRSHLPFVKSTLESVINLRDTPNFQFRDELDAAAGSAVTALGPKLFLEVVPLNIDGTESDQDFPRSWFLPLFKRYIKKSELQFFIDYFLPLSSKFRLKSEELKAFGRLVEATAYNTLQMQCWDLLPVFCKEANDLKTSFPKIAKIMGRALNEYKELQQLIMSALRNVIGSVTKAGENTEVIAQYAKNFLPILFNIYTDARNTKGISLDEDERMPESNKVKSIERLASLETIRIYLGVTPKDLVGTYFCSVQEKAFESPDLSDACRLALFDLMIAMVRYVSESQVDQIFVAVEGLLGSSHHSMQKKAYRILQEICAAHTPACDAFIKSHLPKLQTILLKGLQKAAPSSKGPRISCMEHVFVSLHSDLATRNESKAFLRKIIPEAILCTKESRRSRIAAFSLMIASAKCYLSESSPTENDEDDPMNTESALPDYFHTISVGLRGNPVMMRATVIALSRLMYEFKDDMSSELFDQVVNNVCILFGTNTREVADAAFGFVFVLLHIMDKSVFAALLPRIFEAMSNWEESIIRHFRLRIKHFLKRLIQKYGYETLVPMVPKSLSKFLSFVHKQWMRSKKLAAERSSKHYEDAVAEDEKDHAGRKETMEEILADSSEDECEDKEKQSKPKRKFSSKRATWLQETSDEPLDLLDPTVSQKILMSNPKAQKKSKKEEFDVAPDGRLIIYDGDLSDDEEEKDKIFKSIGIDAKLKSEDNSESTGKKRKFVDDDDSEEDSAPPKKSSYKPGGKGIHRARPDEETGSTFKAKKAGGDVKKKGSHQPYAYMPFNSALLNKRKQKKLTGQYKGLVKAATKGAAAGKKQNLKRKKQK